MKVKAKRRITIAWVLLFALMPLFVVKGIHHHNEQKIVISHSEKGSVPTSNDECLICQFTLSPFTQVETVQICCIIPVFLFEPIFHLNRLRFRPTYSQCLRAPPFLSFIY